MGGCASIAPLVALRPRPGKKGPRNGVGPNAQNVGKKSPDWEIRASRPLPITGTRTATAGFPAAFLGPEFDSGNRASEPRQVATQVSLAS